MAEVRGSVACLDASPILSLLVGEPSERAQVVNQLLESAAARGERLWVFPTTVGEVAITLDRAYKVSRADIAEELLGFLDHRALYLERGDTVRAALATFGAHNVPFHDALLAVEMRAAACTRVDTWDKHFDRIPGVVRQEP